MDIEVLRLREPHQRRGGMVLKSIWEVLPFAVKDFVDRVQKEKEHQVVHLKWPLKPACLCKPKCVCWLLGRTISVSSLPAVLLAGCSLHWPSAGMSTLSHWPCTGSIWWSSYLTECRYKFLFTCYWPSLADCRKDIRLWILQNIRLNSLGSWDCTWTGGGFTIHRNCSDKGRFAYLLSAWERQHIHAYVGEYQCVWVLLLGTGSRWSEPAGRGHNQSRIASSFKKRLRHCN